MLAGVSALPGRCGRATVFVFPALAAWPGAGLSPPLGPLLPHLRGGVAPAESALDGTAFHFASRFAEEALQMPGDFSEYG
ncbi:hypothetical protein ACG10_11195 [Azotobacter chroococcum]|nr:hypothetical protein ACG10_11195 [Azotobacter chroococcum]